MRRASLASAALILNVLCGHAMADKIVKDPLGDVRIRLPAGWSVLERKEGDRSLRAIEPQIEGFVVMTHVRKVDSTLKTLDEYAKVSMRNDFNEGRTSNSRVEGPTSLTVNGHPALQFIQTCNMGVNKYVLVRTYIELDDSWNVLICGSAPSQAEVCRPVFDQVISSFGKAPAASTAPSPSPELKV